MKSILCGAWKGKGTRQMVPIVLLVLKGHLPGSVAKWPWIKSDQIRPKEKGRAVLWLNALFQG